MHKPQGLGWYALFMTINCFIVLNRNIEDGLSDISVLQIIIFLIAPCIPGLICYLLSKRIFLKITGGNVQKSGKYAEYTDDMVFVITIIIIAVLYNLYNTGLWKIKI